MQRKVDYKKYEAITMRGNYEWKLLQEIITRNYYRKLSASIHNHSKNVGIIGILPYPKMHAFKFSEKKTKTLSIVQYYLRFSPLIV